MAKPDYAVVLLESDAFQLAFQLWPDVLYSHIGDCRLFHERVPATAKPLLKYLINFCRKTKHQLREFCQADVFPHFVHKTRPERRSGWRDAWREMILSSVKFKRCSYNWPFQECLRQFACSLMIGLRYAKFRHLTL